VELGQYKGFEVDRVEYIVTDEEVEERIKQTLEQNARWVSVEDRPVKTGDRVILDYSGSIDGELFEGGTAEKQNLEIGSGHFIPGFEEQMVGMELGEEKDLKVTFPEEYHAEELKGKEATFHVKLHEIKEKELPDLDDEFAKDVSEFDTLDEYRADIKQKLEKNAEERSNTELKNNLIDLAVNNAKVDIPDVMVDFELDNMLRDIDNQLRYNGLNIESYLKIANTSIDDFRAQYKDDAYNRVKTQLVIEAIGKAENIEVSEEDYEKQYELLAKQYNQEVETIKKSLQGGLEHLENSIIAEKTIELLVDEAKVTVKEALVKEDVQDK
jgi:trigger factor